jgi:hypothetical protein
MMRPTWLGLIFATITVIAPIAAFPDSTTQSDDRLMMLSVPKTQYRLGEKIVVTLTLHVDSLPVTAVADCFMRGDTSFLVTPKGGKAVTLAWRDRERRCFISSPGRDANAPPPIGGQHSFQFNLTDDYDPPLNAAGTYGLQAIHTSYNGAISKWSEIVPITITQ